MSQDPVRDKKVSVTYPTVQSIVVAILLLYAEFSTSEVHLSHLLSLDAYFSVLHHSNLAHRYSHGQKCLPFPIRH